MDFARMGLPAVVEAYDKKWLAVYYVKSNKDGIYYLACEIDDASDGEQLPAVCSLIRVPKVAP